MKTKALIETEKLTLSLLDGSPEPSDVSVEVPQEGVELIRLSAAQETWDRRLSLTGEIPQSSIHHLWHPDCRSDRTIHPDWDPSILRSSAQKNAPVLALYDIHGTNRLTIALSDCLRPAEICVGVSEERGTLRLTLHLGDPALPEKEASWILRLDSRPVPYYRALRDVASWWHGRGGPRMIGMPEEARLPLYSTWYSFHQNLSAREVEEECALAAEMGLSLVIVDDGWQTDDNNRGYAFCGDWEVTENKFPDFREHVRIVHSFGLKYMLWFSVPFVGHRSRAYKQFEKKLLDPETEKEWSVLDPRFPDVREFLISLYEQMVRRYDIDGFKLDFIDSFGQSGPEPERMTAGYDYTSVPEAVDRLLSDLIPRLRAYKEDLLIEFRQRYIGPVMQRYANMLRAGDVPNNFAGNRVETLDIRLLAGTTPVHADMFLWNSDEPAESAALQFLHTLFAVPQVSIRLGDCSEEHQGMIRRSLAFWREHRDVLLEGELMPQSPELLYPVVHARTEEKFLAAVYTPHGMVDLPDDPPGQIILVNGSLGESLILKAGKNAGSRQIVLWDCLGRETRRERRALTQGVHLIPISPGGTGLLTAL